MVEVSENNRQDDRHPGLLFLDRLVSRLHCSGVILHIKVGTCFRERISVFKEEGFYRFQPKLVKRRDILTINTEVCWMDRMEGEWVLAPL